MWSLIKSWGGTALSFATGGGISWGLVLVAVLACVGSYFYGRHDGYAKAEALGDAKYARLEAAQAQANRLASDTARRIVDAEIVRRDKAEQALLAARATIAAQASRITNRRIDNASHAVSAAATGGCVFGADWVRIWNEALGFGDSDPGGPDSIPGPGGASGTEQAAGAGIPAGAVTDADVLANHADNSKGCRDIKAKYMALREWALGLPKTVTLEEAP